MDDLFTEGTPYQPSSSYSASKASSDHLVQAWHRTYGLPVVVTNCSNNYGSCYFPGKLIPLAFLNAIAGQPIPVYSEGDQIRDWSYGEDHTRALVNVVFDGELGETYNVRGHNEHANLHMVETLYYLLDVRINPKPRGIQAFRELITFVTDRPGHDKRYVMDASKIASALGWTPQETFESSLVKTVDWFLANED